MHQCIIIDIRNRGWPLVIASSVQQFTLSISASSPFPGGLWLLVCCMYGIGPILPFAVTLLCSIKANSLSTLSLLHPIYLFGVKDELASLLDETSFLWSMVVKVYSYAIIVAVKLLNSICTSHCLPLFHSPRVHFSTDTCQLEHLYSTMQGLGLQIWALRLIHCKSSQNSLGLQATCQQWLCAC